jgi:ATP-dependent Clp protease ATP-binding subunit ClpB
MFCGSCWRQVLQTQPFLTLAFVEVENNPKVSQTEKSEDSTPTNLKELEAQLEAAEKEWKEYQNSYKPLIQLEVTGLGIAEVLSSRTGIPVAKMQASQMQQLLQLDVELHKRVIGQNEACNAIARAIQRSSAGLSDPKRPIASLMFMGPTGVKVAVIVPKKVMKIS